MNKEVARKITSHRKNRERPSADTSCPNKKAKSEPRKTEGKPEETMGEIIFSGWLKGPTVREQEVWGAFRQNGVFCCKRSKNLKCDKLHVCIKDLTKEEQLLWFDRMVNLTDLKFNEEVVT